MFQVLVIRITFLENLLYNNQSNVINPTIKFRITILETLIYNNQSNVINPTIKGNHSKLIYREKLQLSVNNNFNYHNTNIINSKLIYRDNGMATEQKTFNKYLHVKFSFW